VIETCGVTEPMDLCRDVQDRPADNAGGILKIWRRPLNLSPCGYGRIELLRFENGASSLVGYVQDRCGVPGTWDTITMFGSDDGHAGFEPNTGRLLIGVVTKCLNNTATCPNQNGMERLIAIDGFTTTFEVLHTYSQQTALGFRVPYMPEGMAGADHFDTYWGPLTKPIDFTQAHPLACDYPTSPPHVGDYLAVADTVPTPATGQGVYYLTAATYQGATRYGRKTTAGQLSGRDPAALPVCAP
jgi:hypothetical protein